MKWWEARHSSRRHFWGLNAHLLMVSNTQPLLLLFKTVFLYLTVGTTVQVMTSAEQAMLCATFFFTITGLLSPIRVVASKTSLSLMAIKKAVLDEDVLHFVLFISVMFVFFILAWEIVDRENTLLFGLVQGFRGLIVGDGDGLDFLGLKTSDKTTQNEEAHGFKVGFGTLGMILFFTFLMQLLIAIFSSTYDDAQKSARLHFHQARAQDLRDAILGLHKFREGSLLVKIMKMLSLETLLSKPYMFKIGCGLFVIGLCMQYGVHVIQQDLFTKLYVVGTLVSILVLTWGAVLMEASVFMWDKVADDWFPSKRDVPTPHRLFIFCRTDYDENIFVGDEQLEVGIEKVNDKIDELTEQFDMIKRKVEEQFKVKEQFS